MGMGKGISMGMGMGMGVNGLLVSCDVLPHRPPLMA